MDEFNLIKRREILQLVQHQAEGFPLSKTEQSAESANSSAYLLSSCPEEGAGRHAHFLKLILTRNCNNSVIIHASVMLHSLSCHVWFNTYRQVETCSLKWPSLCFLSCPVGTWKKSWHIRLPFPVCSLFLKSDPLCFSSILILSCKQFLKTHYKVIL